MLQADRHRGIPLLLRNARRRILHAHHIRRVEDFHSVEGNPTFLRAGLDFCLVAREEDGNPQLAHCRFAAFQNGKRRVIPAECVCNDFHPSDLLSICCAFSCRFIDGCLPPAAGRKELPVPGRKRFISLPFLTNRPFQRRQYAEICSHRLKILHRRIADIACQRAEHRLPRQNQRVLPTKPARCVEPCKTPEPADSI